MYLKMFNFRYGSRTCTEGTLHLWSIRWKWGIGFTFRALLTQKKPFYPSGRRRGEDWMWWQTEQSLHWTSCQSNKRLSCPCAYEPCNGGIQSVSFTSGLGTANVAEALQHTKRVSTGSSQSVCPLPVNLPYFIGRHQSGDLQLLIKLRIY